MTKKTFEAMARLVRAIVDGAWTNEAPIWSPISFDANIETDTIIDGNLPPNIVRAVWTAEAFIVLARAHNPRFDEKRFLKACGLGGKQ